MAFSKCREKPWMVVDFAESICSQLLLKTHFDEVKCSYEAHMFDGLCLWQEFVSTEEFQTKCKLFNPKVEAEPLYLLQNLKLNCENSEKRKNVEFKVDEGDKNCNLSIKFNLEVGVPFTWKFHFSKGPDEAVSKLPLFSMSLFPEFFTDNVGHYQ
eukprot:gene3542-4045_t